MNAKDICRIWEDEDGKFIICDWDNEPCTNWDFDNDADASCYAIQELGFLEVFWME